MPIRIVFPAQFAELIGTDTVSVEGESVGAALGYLTNAYPVLTSLVWPRNGSRAELNPVIVAFLNGEDVRGLRGLASPLKDGDELTVISAVEGG